jgi:ferritin-like metal-binding protein YciE
MTTKTQNNTLDKTEENGLTKNSTETNNKLSENKKEKKTLKDIFEKELKDVYDAEKQLVKALPEMAKAAYSEQLEEAILDHLEQTKKHVDRLEKIFSRLRIDRGAEKCPAMEGLITEGKKIIEEQEESPARDSALIIGAQKIEHYEIAAYGSLSELADVLGYHQVADILDRTLEEEEDTDAILTEIAEEVNDEAYELEDQDLIF